MRAFSVSLCHSEDTDSPSPKQSMSCAALCLLSQVACITCISNDIISLNSLLYAHKHSNKLNFNWTLLICICSSALPTEAQGDVECC